MSQIGDALSIVGATVIGAGVLWGISKLNKTMKLRTPTRPAAIRSPRQRRTIRSPQRQNLPSRTSVRPSPPLRSRLPSSSNSSSSNTSDKRTEKLSRREQVKSEQREIIKNRTEKKLRSSRRRPQTL